jgi:hypothetical protein
MTKVAVLSPHIDDAVFSCAETMLSRPDLDFTIICPYGGFTEETIDKYNRLLAEHCAVLKCTGWQGIQGFLLDDGHPGVSEWYIDDRANEVLRFLAIFQSLYAYDEWWVPLGIHHPDHVACRVAFDRLAPAAQVVFYEELPYRVLYPMLAEALTLRLPATASLVGSSGHLPEKRRLVRMYESQVGPELERHVYAHERLWRCNG